MSKQILFIYIDVQDGFSGQVKATELIVEGVEQRGIHCLRGLLPYLDRSGRSSKWMSVFSFLGQLIKAYAALLLERLPSGGAIHLSLGLTRFALVRDYFALCCASFGSGRTVRKVVALNGSVFSGWSIDSLEARLFRAVIHRCDAVTCVGQGHAQLLKGQGIPPEKIEVVPNVCEYDGITEADCRQKQRAGSRPVELLFLSSLTDTKGYPEYLEALQLMANEPGVRIHAVLCGPIMMDAYRKRFSTQEEAESWIQKMVAEINASERVEVEWIPGAQGVAKRALLGCAQIFVLPTQYPVEAQPLVVLEAMAHGCAIVTTDVGELPSTVDSGSAVILSQPTAATVRDSIEKLVQDGAMREQLALAALRRFYSDFNRQEYLSRWYQLLDGESSV